MDLPAYGFSDDLCSLPDPGKPLEDMSALSFPFNFPSTSEYDKNLKLKQERLENFNATNPFRDASSVLMVRRANDWVEQKRIVNYCLICGKAAYSYKELELCDLYHQRKYECFYQPCKERFHTIEDAQQHWNEKHAPLGQKATYRCNCGEYINDQATLNEHRLRHDRFLNSLNMFCFCQVCDYRTLSPEEFTSHLASHVGFGIQNVDFDPAAFLVPDDHLPSEISMLREEKKRFLSAENKKMLDLRIKTEDTFNFSAPPANSSSSKPVPIIDDETVEIETPLFERPKKRAKTSSASVSNKGSKAPRRGEPVVYMCLICCRTFQRVGAVEKHERLPHDVKNCTITVPGFKRVRKFANEDEIPRLLELKETNSDAYQKEIDLLREPVD